VYFYSVSGLHLERTRIDDTVLAEALTHKFESLCANPQEDDKTWTKVARLLGIYPSHLSMIRRGERQPGPKLLRRLGLGRVISYEEVKER
jgi:hypothetical protein